MGSQKSFHVPYIFKYRAPDPSEGLHVVFLQRMTDIDQAQVLEGLKDTDQDFVQRLDVFQAPAPRQLLVKEWIRDYSPSSAIVMEIAKDVFFSKSDSDQSYSSVIFADSGWDLGHVIAAHWEKSGDDGGNEEGAEWRLAAARVPIGVANALLTACDKVEGMTLAHALGTEAYERSKVDLYADIATELSPQPSSKRKATEWPSHLPEPTKLAERDTPFIISLRHLDESTIRNLKQEIAAGNESSPQDVEILNWNDPDSEPTDRFIIRDIFRRIAKKPEKEDQRSTVFFIDYLLQGPSGKPQILAVSSPGRSSSNAIDLLPTFTEEFLVAHGKATRRVDLTEEPEIDIWKREHLDDFENANGDNMQDACPIFFLRPFTPDEERKIRAAICELGSVEDGESWGHDFMWHGYIFNDGKSHTIEDLRDLFERCDPFSPSYDPKNPGPYDLRSYPNNFVAVDDKIFDAEEPEVWLASTLDFHGEDVSDSLGWIYGRLDPQEVSITYVNLDIANMGPEECLNEGTVDHLWLSDLTAYREEDWRPEE